MRTPSFSDSWTSQCVCLYLQFITMFSQILITISGGFATCTSFMLDLNNVNAHTIVFRQLDKSMCMSLSAIYHDVYSDIDNDKWWLCNVHVFHVHVHVHAQGSRLARIEDYEL